MTVNKITTAPTSNEVTEKINEIIDNLGGSIVDQSYDPTSSNAQSGIAISGAGFLQNKGTGTNSLALLGTATGNRGVGLGQTSEGGGAYATGLGTGAKATGNYAIQIGYGTNSTASTLSVGFNASSSANRKNWQLLDGTTGLIPKERLPFLGRNMGEIVTSTIPLTDAGLHLLDGALISGSGSYADFVTYIAGLVSNYPDLFETEANWQTSVTTYGVCGKFVYDSVNNTVRLPKYSNKIYTQELDTTAPVIGNGKTLGFTNGTTNVGLGTYNTEVYFYGNAYDKAVSSTSVSGNANSGIFGVTTDPTKSGIIAQLSDITTSLDGYYYIVVATSTKTDIQVDIDEIATDLNGKADVDLTNLSAGLTNTICTTPATTTSTASSATPAVVTENYVNGTSWYRVYSDGWCEQGGYVGSASGTSTVTFLKPFINTDYVILKTMNSTSTNNTQFTHNSFTSRETTSAKTASGGAGYSWQACGYIR